MDNINEMENIRNKCVNANSIDLQIHIVMFMRNCINELKWSSPDNPDTQLRRFA